MAKSNNFFDLVLAIVAPELVEFKRVVQASKVISKANKAIIEKHIAQIKNSLPTLKGNPVQVKQAQELIARTMGEANPKRAFERLLAQPQQFAAGLKDLGVKGRKELGEAIADATGGIEEASLSSSWIASGVYEETAFGAGTLTLTLLNGKSYDYYNVPILVWNQMKQAHGKNGSGAGSVFWNLFLRAAKKTRSHQKLALAFRLSS